MSPQDVRLHLVMEGGAIVAAPIATGTMHGPGPVWECRIETVDAGDAALLLGVLRCAFERREPVTLAYDHGLRMPMPYPAHVAEYWISGSRMVLHVDMPHRHPVTGAELRSYDTPERFGW